MHTGEEARLAEYVVVDLRVRPDTWSRGVELASVVLATCSRAYLNDVEEDVEACLTCSSET